jgi:hypothetical protein
VPICTVCAHKLPYVREPLVGVRNEYLSVFVLIAQFFMKIPALKALAPTQSEPPFLGTEVVVMVVFIVLGVLEAKWLPAEAVHAA